MAIEASKKQLSTFEIYFSSPLNLIQSAFLVLTWIVMGAHLEIVSPTMSILAHNAGVAYSGMGGILAARAIGYLSANIFGAIAQNIVQHHSEALLVVAFVCPSLVVFVTPFAKSFILLSILFFIQGISQGFTDLGGTNILFKMWGVNAAAPLSCAHLGYGIGAVFVNLIVRPFLTEDNSNNTNIYIPYSVVAVLCIIIAIGHLVFYIKKRNTKKEELTITQVDDNDVNLKKKKSSKYSPSVCGHGYFQYGLLLSIIFILYTFFIGGNDQTFSKFFFSYLKSKEFNISSKTASWGIILYWLSYSIGRLIFAIVSLYISVQLCLNIIWFCGLCLAIFWFLFVWIIGLTGTSLLVLGSITGLVFSPVFPLSFALINQRLNVIPILLASLLAGSSIGATVFQSAAGFVMDKNANHFPTILILCVLMSIILYIISNLIYFFHQKTVSAGSRHPEATTPLKTISDDEQQMADFLKKQEENILN